MSSNLVQEAIKARKEAEAQAADPTNKPDAPQINSSAATQEGQQIIDAAEAVKTGAPTAAKIGDTASDIRPAVEFVAEPHKVVSHQLPEITKEDFEAAKGMRMFRHVYAGATAILPSGKTIRFGGSTGSAGFYGTQAADEIAFLEELANTSGSQISEVGHEKESHVAEFQHDLQEGAAAARANTERFQNPNTLKAFENLETSIRRNS